MVDSPQTALPNDTWVVRGGQNTPVNFAKGSGIAVGEGGKLEKVSVNCAPDLSIEELTAPNSQTGYPGIPHSQVGVTTVGAVRAAGGDVVSSPTRTNPNHATLSGLTPDQASRLFRPTIRNPNQRNP